MRGPAVLDRLPLRGEALSGLGLPLPAAGEPAVGPGAPRLPRFSAGRPLKRWRYVAAFGPELMLCAGDARIGPLRQRWWAVAEPGAAIVERTSAGGAGLSLAQSGRAGAESPAAAAVGAETLELRIASEGVRAHVRVDLGGRPRGVEVVSRSGRRAWAWTRKRAGLPARATVELRGRRHSLELEAVIDDSAGYHARRTSWRWSTGVGRAASGERVAWNLVSGVHDSIAASERAIWIDGEPAEVGPVSFDDLSRVRFPDGGELHFDAWAAREHRTNVLLVRSAYRQPFGTFTGQLPGGVVLAEGYGVMEEHDVRW